MRKEAKAKQAGLITVSITMPNGDRVEEQGLANVEQCMFAKWAAAILFCDEVRQLPELQGMVQQLMRNNQ